MEGKMAVIVEAEVEMVALMEALVDWVMEYMIGSTVTYVNCRKCIQFWHNMNHRYCMQLVLMADSLIPEYLYMMCHRHYYCNLGENIPLLSSNTNPKLVCVQIHHMNLDYHTALHVA